MTEKDKLKLAIFDDMLAALCYALQFTDNATVAAFIDNTIDKAKDLYENRPNPF